MKEKSPLDVAHLCIHFPLSFIWHVPASNKPESFPIRQEESSQAKGCATVPSILSYQQKILQIRNTHIEKIEVEVQDSKASFSASDSYSSSQVSDTNLSFDSNDLEEKGLLIQN